MFAWVFKVIAKYYFRGEEILHNLRIILAKNTYLRFMIQNCFPLLGVLFQVSLLQCCFPGYCFKKRSW